MVPLSIQVSVSNDIVLLVLLNGTYLCLKSFNSIKSGFNVHIQSKLL